MDNYLFRDPVESISWPRPRIDVITGSFDSDIFTAGGSLRDRIWIEGATWVEPTASLSFAWGTRDAFIASNGTFVPGSDIRQGLFSFGPTAGTFIPVDAGPLRGIEPYGSINGVWEFVRDPGGTRFGASASAGIGFSFDNAIRATASVSYFGLGSDFRSVSFTANMSIPFD